MTPIFKEPSEVGVIPPQFMSNSSLSSSFSSTMNSSYSKLDTHTSSSFSAAAHRSLSPERPQASTAHHWYDLPLAITITIKIMITITIKITITNTTMIAIMITVMIVIMIAIMITS